MALAYSWVCSFGELRGVSVQQFVGVFGVMQTVLLLLIVLMGDSSPMFSFLDGNVHSGLINAIFHASEGMNHMYSVVRY